MRSSLWTSFLLTLIPLLASCGGGGSPSPTPYSPTSTATCDSTHLWAAHPATSGTGIPDNNNTGISVRWDNQNCSLRTISAATVEICLSHDRPSDLTWTLKPPGSTAPLTLTAPADWNVSASSCDIGIPGMLQRIDLLTTLQVTANTRGIWTLNVKDLGLGGTGTLNRWRILLVGNT